ncbi:MAG: hypothetical protein JO246_04715 [Frankiaceae bacterium]|nr:hypothetical protein [Frankiaceae bacterium]MBV9871886.1 hypothetical protein [Frankiaceae bacterium]
MTRIFKTGTILTAAAMSLAVGAPALASGHPAKDPKLVHTHLTLKATQEKVNKNDKFKATVVAKLRAKKAGLAAETVSLQERSKGADSKWSDTGVSGTTADDGTAAFTFTQSENKQQYRVVFAGDDTYAKSHSGNITIKRLKAAKTPPSGS